MPVRLREPTSLTILAVLAVIGVLYAAKAVFIPLAMALLLTFVLAPPVRLLRSAGAPHVVACIVVVIIAFSAISAIAFVLGQQLTDLAERLPRYEINILRKIEDVRTSTLSGGKIDRFWRFLNDLNNEISRNEPPPTVDPSSSKPDKPIQVQSIDPSSPTTVFKDIVRPFVEPIATLGLMVIFVVFFLLERESLRDRFITLIGSHDLRRTTEALNDGARRLSRYFLAQSALNLLFGVIVGVGLTIIGIPNPVLWGILAFLLRFVPYIGALLAALCPIAIAIAVDPGWMMVIWTVALFAIVEPVLGQVVEPLIYGHSTGLTPVAVIVSATLWTWIWGPVGLVLSTPLAVCLAVIGRHIESLQFLEVMLGDERPLSPAQRFYQRALADTPDEAIEQIEEKDIKAKNLAGRYDEVILAALTLAQVDVLRGVLDDRDIEKINHVIRSIIAETDHISYETTKNSGEHVGPHLVDPKRALCVSGPGPFDGAAAEMLALLLRKSGADAEVVGASQVSALTIDQLKVDNIDLLFLSHFNLGSPNAHQRMAIRRLRRRSPGSKIIACLWGHDQGHLAERQVEELAADDYALCFEQCLSIAAGSPARSLPAASLIEARVK
jgi:predicted PurR-regulated permease PerM